MHTPSEHKFDGKNYPLEIHFVNKTEDGKIAVLGVMVKEGTENATLKEMFDSLPTKVTTSDTLVSLKQGFNPADVFPIE